MHATNELENFNRLHEYASRVLSNHSNIKVLEILLGINHCKKTTEPSDPFKVLENCCRCLCQPEIDVLLNICGFRCLKPNFKNVVNNRCSNPAQVFLHIPDRTVLCAVVSLHEQVGSLKQFLKFKQQKLATFYTARNIKLDIKLTFSEQCLENECNIYVRFNEGLVGGSGNYNSNDALFPDQGDYQTDQGSGYSQFYQTNYGEFPSSHQFPVGYQQPGYQHTIPQNPGNQSLLPDHYYANQFQHYGEVHYNNRRRHVHNLPQFNPLHSGYEGGHANRGNHIRQMGRGYMPHGGAINQFQQQSSIASSTAQRTQTLPHEQHPSFNVPSSVANVSPSLIGGTHQHPSGCGRTHSPKSNTTTSNEQTLANAGNKPTSPNVDTIGSKLSNVDKISGQAKYADTEDTNLNVDVSGKPLNAKTKKINEIADIVVEGDSNISVHFGSAQPVKTSINHKKSNQNVKELSKDSFAPVTSSTPVPSSDDITTAKEGPYNHLTISKSDKMLGSGGSQDKFAETFLRSTTSSSSKVFSPGLASRDSTDVYIDSFSSTSAAFAPTSTEGTTSLTGKPVIQASDKESSVTDVMNHEFKSLTTGDFMLTLKCRQFQEIPSEILRDQRCKHTTKINISSNRLKDIPKYLDIDHFPSMKILDASKNKLVDLPANIEEFRGMENLDISHNQCRIFPEVVTTLKQLKILKVNNNSIEYIPKGLGFYKELEILRLEGNKLTRIPEDIKNLESLQYLNISDNRLDDFPLVICTLKKLQYLYLSSNKIKIVPHYLYLNECLEVVQVDKNPIVKPPTDVLSRPIQEIRRYCKEIVAGRFKDDRIVILIQGTLNSGKSSVCSALCSDVTKRAVKPTEAIEERAAVIRDINVTIREFSGDSHYQGLTEIFIVHNALYLVTVDLRKFSVNQDNAVWFECNVWHYLKKVLDRHTVFIIGTHADLISFDSVQHLLDSLLKKVETALKNENKHLHLEKGFVNNTIDSFDRLKDEVTRCLLNRNLFPERGQYRPVKWKDAEPDLITYRKVNQAVNAQQKTALWVPIKTANDLWTQNDFGTQEDMKSFLRYLRSVGTILWHEGFHLLKTFICANPSMLIKCIKIILSKDHKEAFMKAYKPRWRLNPVPEDDVTYVIACQMYLTRGCINMESIRRILKAVVEDKEDINMIVIALAHFDVCREMSVCTPDIKIMEIQEGLDAGATHQEEVWPQLANDVLQPNSPFNDDELPYDVLNIVARRFGKDWFDLAIKLGFSKADINSVSAQFPGKLEDAILHILITWKQKAIERGRNVKNDLMENLECIGRHDLKATVMEFDRHASLAHQLRLVLPSWRKLKKEKIYFFPAYLKNGEKQMWNFWQVIRKKLMIHRDYCFNLGADHGRTIDEVFMKCYEVVVENTLSHQIWKNGILTEGIDEQELGILYYYQISLIRAEIFVNVSAASIKAIPKYCEDKVNFIIEQVTKA